MKRYGFARALLPGLLCFTASAMYDESNKAKGVQSALYAGAFVSIGVWSGKNQSDLIAPILAAGAGWGAGQAYKTLTRG